MAKKKTFYERISPQKNKNYSLSEVRWYLEVMPQYRSSAIINKKDVKPGK